MVADENEELRRRKLAAAAEHAVWVREQADAAVAGAELKVEKARADLNGARDSLTNLQQAAKEAAKDADARRADAEQAGAVGPVASNGSTQAQAQSAGVGTRVSGRN